MRLLPEEFVAEYRVTIGSERTANNPRLIVPSDLAFDGTHWKSVLRRRRATRSTLTVYFSRSGSGSQPPTAAEVLDSLAVDALQAENGGSAEEVAAELGHPAATAVRYLELCKKRANGLKRVLGTVGYDALLYRTRRIPG